MCFMAVENFRNEINKWRAEQHNDDDGDDNNNRSERAAEAAREKIIYLKIK